MISNPNANINVKRRQALAKVYALLIRLAETAEKQTAHPDDFGEKTGKAEEQPYTKVEAILSYCTPNGERKE